MLARHFLLPFIDSAFGPAATMADVRLTKFDALPEESLASIRTEVSAAELKYDYEQPPWGRVAIISETQDMGLYSLQIAPGETLPLHHHEVMREAEFIMDDGLRLLTLDQAPRDLSAGEVVEWPHKTVHGYQNVSDHWCRVLCIDSPPFIPGDEIQWKGST